MQREATKKTPKREMTLDDPSKLEKESVQTNFRFKRKTVCLTKIITFMNGKVQNVFEITPRIAELFRYCFLRGFKNIIHPTIVFKQKFTKPKTRKVREHADISAGKNRIAEDVNE
jgi:hypothetical protein